MDALIENIIDQYYVLAKGEKIEKVDEYISLGTGIKIRRRLLKHIVEQRMAKDHMTKEEIKNMMRKIPNLFENRQIEIVNPNQRTFPDSKIIGKLDPEVEKGLLVIKIDQQSFEEIIDAFYREEKRFNKMLNSS